jgi:protein-S-isoprenylcysteine O-methyltransferase Ste14
MTLFPPLTLGWLNGWIPVVAFYGAFLILLRIFPRKTIDRLYENSGWTLKQARPAWFGFPFDLAALILLPLNTLKFGWPGFWIGLILYIISFSGFLYSLHTYNITPVDRVVTDGLYRISRNPQWVSMAITLVAISLMVGSWTILFLISVRIVLNHFRILGEEIVLEKQYGQSYLDYKNSVPRYFIFL